MHRAFGRSIRSHCRKWRETECPPVVAGEEVKKNKDEKKREFVPPKHSLEEAVTMTASLVLGYHLTHHHRRRHALFGESPPVTATTENCFTYKPVISEPTEATPKQCPFSLSSIVFTQPIFQGRNTSSLSVKTNRTSSTSAVIKSIDVTPFIKENHSQEPLLSNRAERLSSISDDDDDEDDSIVFEEDESPAAEVQLRHSDQNKYPSFIPFSQSSPSDIDSSAAEYGKRIGGDLLSVLGSFEFLKAESDAMSSNSNMSKKKLKKMNSKKNGVFGKNPPIQALDLMKKGAELGSGRALYNLGVAYDRMNDPSFARQHYKKAADLGHPLAIYNCAVFALKDGHLTEGYALMKTASDFGVAEAKDFMNPTDENLISQLRNLQVGNV